MKNRSFLVITIVAIFLTAFALITLLTQSPKEAYGAKDERVEYKSSTASSTVTYLTANSSSTIPVLIRGADTFNYDFCATGSSSASTLLYRVQYSMDEGTDNKTWFWETANTLSSGVNTHVLAEHRMSLATTTAGTNYLCATITSAPTGAKWAKIIFSVTGNNAAIWNSVTPKVEL
jgi:hypothetical protein